MPFCPKCRTEYVDGISKCSDCLVPLVNELEEQIEGTESEPTLLTSLSDSFYANQIEAYLKEHEIPVLKKHRGAGAYVEIITGSSCMGIDLYVRNEDLLIAQELLKNIEGMTEIPEEEWLEPETKQTEQKSNHVLVFFLGLFFLVLLLLYFLIL